MRMSDWSSDVCSSELLAGSFSDNNVSPEVTLTYRPSSSLTTWISYKTRFKSGGFALTSPMQSTARLSDIDFDFETVKGDEVGLRGDFAAFKFNATAFLYELKDLQVNVYIPVTLPYVLSDRTTVVSGKRWSG